MCVIKWLWNHETRFRMHVLLRIKISLERLQKTWHYLLKLIRMLSCHTIQRSLICVENDDHSQRLCKTSFCTPHCIHSLIFLLGVNTGDRQARRWRTIHVKWYWHSEKIGVTCGAVTWNCLEWQNFLSFKTFTILPHNVMPQILQKLMDSAPSAFGVLGAKTLVLRHKKENIREAEEKKLRWCSAIELQARIYDISKVTSNRNSVVRICFCIPHTAPISILMILTLHHIMSQVWSRT